MSTRLKRLRELIASLESTKVLPGGIMGAVLFLEIDGKLFGYRPHRETVYDLEKKFFSIYESSPAKALVWLKRNSTLASRG